MQQTPNFALKKIELTDSPPDITVINPNWDTIDQALKNLQDAINSGATDEELLQLRQDLATHLENKANPHGVTKLQVGLGNVDNVKQIPASEKGKPNGVAALDPNGKVINSDGSSTGGLVKVTEIDLAATPLISTTIPDLKKYRGIVIECLEIGLSALTIQKRIVVSAPEIKNVYNFRYFNYIGASSGYGDWITDFMIFRNDSYGLATAKILIDFGHVGGILTSETYRTNGLKNNNTDVVRTSTSSTFTFNDNHNRSIVIEVENPETYKLNKGKIIVWGIPK